MTLAAGQKWGIGVDNLLQNVTSGSKFILLHMRQTFFLRLQFSLLCLIFSVTNEHKCSITSCCSAFCLLSQTSEIHI